MNESNQAAATLYDTYVAYYDSYAIGLTGDVQFYIEEAQKAGSPVLELGCGTGRVLIPIAESGVTIIGLDRAPAMFSIARRKISTLDMEAQQRIELVEGDMRSFSLGQRFKLITIPYRAFLHLLTPEDQRQALECIREHLTDDGRLIFDIPDPRVEAIAAHTGVLGAALKKEWEFIHPDTEHRVVVWESRHYDLEHQILKQDLLFEEVDGDGKVIAKTYLPLTFHYVYRYEMQYLLELCGYRIESLYGDFQRGPFRYGGEQIWVAQRR